MKCKCGAFINPAWAACPSCRTALEKPKTVRMTPDVAIQLAVDSEGMFIHFWRRLVKRFNHVMRPGYLAWVQTHQPELWARREAARIAWDTMEAYQAFKDCRTPWMEYRRRVHRWAMVELAAIRRHREHLDRAKRHAA